MRSVHTNVGWQRATINTLLYCAVFFTHVKVGSWPSCVSGFRTHSKSVCVLPLIFYGPSFCAQETSELGRMHRNVYGKEAHECSRQNRRTRTERCCYSEVELEVARLWRGQRQLPQRQRQRQQRLKQRVSAPNSALAQLRRRLPSVSLAPCLSSMGVERETSSVLLSVSMPLSSPASVCVRLKAAT